ncbi:MAG: hypothetical protein HUU20_16890 [Pirellulales bacterium]|nr:hypothetical protein [Pirellulales bacterium]
MRRPVLSRLDTFMRLGHLYTGLLLAPWMAVYATSAFCLNHEEWFGLPNTTPMHRWEVVREVQFAPGGDFPQDSDERARTILRQVGLDGPHRVMGEPNDTEIAIYRLSAGGDYRVAWRRGDSQITVQRQQPASVCRYFHFFHFGRGYDGRYLGSVVWALSIDAVTVSTWFWIISGVYLWARRPKKTSGAVCLVAGCLLFAWLWFLLSR